MDIHNFHEKYTFSRGEREKSDVHFIEKVLDGCVDVRKTDELEDKAGVDYVATLRRGAEVTIDAKRRKRGESKWWKHGEPELALEDWSVMPSLWGEKIGWTLDESKECDLILYLFHPDDSKEGFLFGFQMLRLAFRKNYRAWKDDFDHKEQKSSGAGDAAWKSSAVFVPVSVVLKAILDVSVFSLEESA